MSADKNNLFPVFFKLEELRVLIIGAGEIGHEKLNTVLNNSPAANVTVAASFIKKEVRELAFKHKHVQLIQTSYHAELLDNSDLIIAAVNDIELAERIRKDAKQKGKLLNAADKPSLCDFYLGSVVTKGDVKIAISTNGKSPTLARRLKEFFNEVLPEEIESLTNNLNTIRNNIQSGLKARIKKLNEITASLVEDNEKPV